MRDLYSNGLLIYIVMMMLFSGCGTHPDSDGKMFRGTLQRTGVYNAKGAHHLGEVKLNIRIGGLDLCASSPAVYGGIAYVGTGNNLFVVDVEKGQEMWKFETGNFVVSSPAIAGGIVYFGSCDHNLYALNAKTGQEVWRFTTEDTIMSSPAVSNGVVYFGSFDGYLYAVGARRGKEIWRFRTGDIVFSSPSINDGVVYFGSGDHNLYAVDVRTGKEIWRFAIEDSILSSPAIANGGVYFSGFDGNLYALDAGTGRELWRFKAGRYLVSSPAVTDSVIYLGSDDRHLYAVDAATGTEKWHFKARADITSSPAIANGIVYFGSDDHCLYAIDSNTGQEMWRFRGKGYVKSSPAVVDRTVYFTSEYGYLYALEGGVPPTEVKPKRDIEILTEWAIDDSGKLMEREVPHPRIVQNVHILQLALETYYHRSGGYYPLDTLSYCSTGYAGKGTSFLDPKFAEAEGPHLRTSFRNPYGDTLSALRIGYEDPPDWSPELVGQLVWIPVGRVSTESKRNVPDTLATGYRIYAAGPTGFYSLVLKPPRVH